MIEGTAHIPVCMKESQRLKIQHGFPKTPSFQGKLLGLTPCQVVLECILLHMHWSQLLFFQPNSQGKIYERNQFPFLLHLVEMLLLPVHENRQLGVLFKFHDHVWSIWSGFSSSDESVSTSEILISLPMLLVSASSISDRLKPSNSLSPSSELKKDFHSSAIVYNNAHIHFHSYCFGNLRDQI